MWRALTLVGCLTGGAAWGQTDDRDYLTAFLEDTLSGVGRTVTVTGFTGALSSQASIEQLTIADDQGVWITLNGVVLDWSRSALLSGEVEVGELSAKEIIVARVPEAGEDATPSPEAQGFSLPDLPVSINIGRLAAERIELAPEILGQEVTGTLEASLQLAGGEGQAVLDLIRTGDGPAGEIRLDASYGNTSRDLRLSFLAEEAAGGLVVEALGVPGSPAARLEVLGQGKIDDFLADIGLATDGAERLAGQVTIKAEDGGYRLGADLSGDLAPVLAPDLIDFFGTEVGLKLDAWRSTAGRVIVDHFDLTTRSLMVSGSGEVAADGLPERVDITGTLALPFTDGTRVSRADFQLTSVQKDDDSWSGSVAIAGLDRADIKIADLVLDGSGRIGRTPAGNSFGGTISAKATGVAPTDQALAEALGPDLTASLRLFLLEGSDALQLSDIRLAGAGMTGTGALKIEGLDKDLLTSGSIVVEASDFARFSRLLGRKLGGAGRMEIAGSASRLSGFFDAEVTVDGRGLAIDQTEVDRLLAGESRLKASLRRDETGTFLRDLDLEAGGLTAQASGRISSTGSDLTGTVSLADLSVLGNGYAGGVTLDGRFTGTPEDGSVTLTGRGQSLRIGNREADRLLAGQSLLDLDLGLKNGVIQIRSAKLQNPQLTASAKGQIAGATRA